MNHKLQKYLVFISEESIYGGFFDSWDENDNLTVRLPQNISQTAWQSFLYAKNLDLKAKLSVLNPVTIGLRNLTIENASQKLIGIVAL